MLKFLGNDTWAVVKGDDILVQAKIWYYDQLPSSHSLHKVGLIGEFKCNENTTTLDSKLLFDKLSDELKAVGATRIVGPMDGNTWQSYRLTTYYGEHSPFFLEPYTPQYFIKHWENAGFEVDETYSSYITNIENWSDERVPRLESKFSELLFSELKSTDLSSIFDLSIKSFSKNPYYISIDKETYLNKYGKMMSLLDPNVSLVVYDGEELVGYLFAMLDVSQKLNGEKINRVILKTIAVKEDRKYAGLGTYLLSELVKNMKKIGIEYAIHALMYDNNAVQNIIKHNSEKLRGYTLYQRKI